MERYLHARHTPAPAEGSISTSAAGAKVGLGPTVAKSNGQGTTHLTRCCIYCLPGRWPGRFVLRGRIQCRYHIQNVHVPQSSIRNLQRSQTDDRDSEAIRGRVWPPVTALLISKLDGECVSMEARLKQ